MHRSKICCTILGIIASFFYVMFLNHYILQIVTPVFIVFFLIATGEFLVLFDSFYHCMRKIKQKYHLCLFFISLCSLFCILLFFIGLHIRCGIWCAVDFCSSIVLMLVFANLVEEDNRRKML